MSPRRNFGFTLVELLVVVAVIALLIALLLPSLRGARAQAREVKCRTQLREYTRGFQYYLTEFRDTFPPADYGPLGSDVTSPTWFELIDKYWLGATDSQADRAAAGRSFALARCPELSQGRSTNTISWEWNYSWRSLGYGYNRWWLGWNLFMGNPNNPPPPAPGPAAPKFWRRLSEVLQPAECLELGDSLARFLPLFNGIEGAGHYLGWRNMVSQGAGVDTRHGATREEETVPSTYQSQTSYYLDGRGNIGWVDGHVAARHSVQINDVVLWRPFWDPQRGTTGY